MRFAVSFERREGADVVNAPLFVERRHRLSSNDLSAGRSHCRITDIRVDHPDCALNHIPAVVDLGHNPIGFVLAEELGGRSLSRILLLPGNRQVFDAGLL